MPTTCDFKVKKTYLICPGPLTKLSDEMASLYDRSKVPGAEMLITASPRVLITELWVTMEV